MKTELNKLVAALTMLFLATASTVRADVLDGQTVRTNLTVVFHGPGEPYAYVANIDRVVGPEIEIMNLYVPPYQENFIDIDFSDTNILITLIRGTAFSSTPPVAFLGFEDAFGTIPRFTSVTVNPETTWTGLRGGNFGVQPNRIGVFLEGGFPGAQISLDITGMIPEPATAGLMLVSIAFLVTGRRFR